MNPALSCLSTTYTAGLKSLDNTAYGAAQTNFTASPAKFPV